MTHMWHLTDNCLLMSSDQLSSGSVTYLSTTGILIEFEGKIN